MERTILSSVAVLPGLVAAVVLLILCTSAIAAAARTSTPQIDATIVEWRWENVAM